MRRQACFSRLHLPEEANGAATRIHFIDVGQADATLIEQNGEFALIDAGY